MEEMKKAVAVFGEVLGRRRPPRDLPTAVAGRLRNVRASGPLGGSIYFGQTVP